MSVIYLLKHVQWVKLPSKSYLGAVAVVVEYKKSYNWKRMICFYSAVNLTLCTVGLAIYDNAVLSSWSVCEP